MYQAADTAALYADKAVVNLCGALDIDPRDPNKREKLAPFAPVLAAMIAASAADYDTTMRGGQSMNYRRN
jgi:hypothetical protein